jgi:hypothetical protein
MRAACWLTHVLAKPAPLTSALLTLTTWMETAEPGHQSSAGRTGASAICPVRTVKFQMQTVTRVSFLRVARTGKDLMLVRTHGMMFAQEIGQFLLTVRPELLQVAK